MISTHPIRFAQVLVGAAIAIALALPAVAHGGGDWFERYAAAHPYGVGAPGATATPDMFERYATAHPYGIGVPARPDADTRHVRTLCRSHPYGIGALRATAPPDMFERYAAAHPYGIGALGVIAAPDTFRTLGTAHPTASASAGSRRSTRGTLRTFAPLRNPRPGQGMGRVDEASASPRRWAGRNIGDARMQDPRVT